MYGVIKRFADRNVSTGLMLIDMTTGSGKTYSAVKYIFDACLQEENENVKKQRDKKDAALRDYLPSIESNLREKSEPAFRRIVSDFLNKKYSTVEKKLYAIKTEKEWQWLGKLYPAVFTRDRQVLLMSMDKLLSRNTTIVEPSYMFYNNDDIIDRIYYERDKNSAHKDDQYVEKEYLSILDIQKEMETQIIHVAAISEQMGRTPPWAEGLMLVADGYETAFYMKKGKEAFLHRNA